MGLSDRLAPILTDSDLSGGFSSPYCDGDYWGNRLELTSGQTTEVRAAFDPSCRISMPSGNALLEGEVQVGQRLSVSIPGADLSQYDSVKYYWYVEQFYPGVEPSYYTEKAGEDEYYNSQTMTLTERHQGRRVRAVIELQKDGGRGFVASAAVKVPGVRDQKFDEMTPEEIAAYNASHQGNSGVSGDVAQSTQPAVEASVEAVGQGGAVEFEATGFVPGEPVTFVVHSEPVTVGTVPADQSGRAAISWVVPAGFELGEHRVIATGLKSGRSSVDLFEVRASSFSGNLWSWLVGLGSGSTSANGGAGSSSAAGAVGGSSAGSAVGAGVNTPGVTPGTSASTGAQTAGDAGKDGSVASVNGSADVDAKVSVKVVAKGMPVTGADATTVVAVAALLLAAGAGMTLRRVNR